MIDFAALDEQGKKQILEFIRVSVDNPIESAKMKAMQQLILLKDFAEKRLSRDMEQFFLMYSGVEANFIKAFDDMQKEIERKCNVPTLADKQQRGG